MSARKRKVSAIVGGGLGVCPLPSKKARQAGDSDDTTVSSSGDGDDSGSGKSYARTDFFKKRPTSAPSSSSSSSKSKSSSRKAKAKKPKKTHIPAFLVKTYEIMDSATTKAVASWTNEGRCIMIHDLDTFSGDVLPKYFKHNNFTSFVRQLNMYGFHKTKQDPQWREFQHPMFKRGHKHLLKHIKRNRRPAGQGMIGGRSTNSDSVETVLEEFPTVKLQLAEMERNYDVLCATLHELWSHTRALKDEHDALKGNIQAFGTQLASSIESGNMMLSSIRQLWQLVVESPAGGGGGGGGAGTHRKSHHGHNSHHNGAGQWNAQRSLSNIASLEQNKSLSWRNNSLEQIPSEASAGQKGSNAVITMANVTGRSVRVPSADSMSTRNGTASMHVSSTGTVAAPVTAQSGRGAYQERSDSMEAIRQYLLSAQTSNGPTNSTTDVNGVGSVGGASLGGSQFGSKSAAPPAFAMGLPTSTRAPSYGLKK